MSNLQLGSLVVVIVGLCEALKQAGLKGKYVPVLAVVLGLIGSVYFSGTDFLSTAAGVVVGLATTGGYTLVKKLVQE
jgi:hypothetical protein